MFHINKNLLDSSTKEKDHLKEDPRCHHQGGGLEVLNTHLLPPKTTKTMNKQRYTDKTNFGKALNHNKEASGAFWGPEIQEGPIEMCRKDFILSQCCSSQWLHWFTYPPTEQEGSLFPHLY